jgi:hypothetical protein
MRRIISIGLILLSAIILAYILFRPSGEKEEALNVDDWDTVNDSQNREIKVNPNNGEWVFLIKGLMDTTIVNGPYPGLPPTSEQVELVSYDETGKDSVTIEKFMYIIENSDTANKKCVIRLFDDEGKLLKTVIKDGECVGSLKDSKKERKSIISKNGDLTEVTLIDYPQGNILGTAFIPYDSLSKIPDVELLDNKIIVVDQKDDSFYVFINFVGQTSIQDHFIMPGKFKTAIDNGENLKFFVTESSNGTYGDVFIIEDSLRNRHIHSGGAVPGYSDDLQIHKINNEWRIFHSIYDPTNNSTTLRIYDQNGSIIKQNILRGKINTTDLHPKQNPVRKIYLTDDADKTQIYIFELQSGDQLTNGGTINGRYQDHELQNHQLKVKTTYQGHDYERTFNLP